MEEKEINIEELLKKAENEQETVAPEAEAKAAEEEKTDTNVTDEEGKTDEESAPADPLAELQNQVDELKKEMLYKQAEFENYRKRTIKEKADLILGGGEKTIKEILPVLDDFERALADKTDDVNAVREGMQLIFNKFVSTLEKLGVKKIETEGADFNVDFHEAIALVPGLGDEMKGKVIDCTKTGYTLNDKVIRHAQVAVGQ
jgi:molecular chaperone GrpE